MNCKKVISKALVPIFAIFAISAASAISVDRNEIQSAGGPNEIVFRNYSGPHSVINTIEQIRAIGSSLGNQVKPRIEKSGTIGDSSRYAVIHAVDPSTKEKFDADIFIIGKNATVDHITNLRRIISAYLSSAYGYSTKDADTIATFVTVYNAVYRKNTKYFESKYKEIVTKNLSSAITGLSTNYEEWPGKTQIVIPLSDLNGGLSTIDTSLISDKEVVKSMQGEEDKGIEARKDMVDIKEREADNAQEKADNAQAKADEEKAKLAEEQRKKAEQEKAAAEAKAKADKAKADADKAKADAEKAKKDAEEAKKKAEQAKQNAKNNPTDANAKKEAEQAKKDADQAKKDADQAKKDADTASKEADTAQKEADNAQQKAEEQSQKTEEQTKTAQAAQETADTAQNTADQKRSEAQEERTAIAKDQQTLIAETEQNNFDIMYGLKNIDEAGVTSALVKMNLKTGKVIKESPVSVIRGRTVYEDGEKFIAVAGTNIGAGAVRLVTIDKKTLEINAESAERLSELSVLVEKDGSYYCTIQEGITFYIGKYNNNAELLLKSSTAVKAATPITITAGGIMVTDANGVPVILNLSNLASISPQSTPSYFDAK
ncbi:P83/100 family protein [uncultured Treponema sp.]|uniref:P83/100 family protein n=1 Tax=uncultured Treponema sp. TaxID=162155 RepID=UPI0025D12049|nr:P83/100 family protein [uncultured Treponema sp.]